MSDTRATFLVIGQANAGNHGPVRASGGPAMRVFYEGSFLPAHDPLPGASGGGGSVWTRFGPRAIAAGLCDELVMLNVAHGDTAVADWGPGGRMHSRLSSAIRKAQETGIVFTHVIWHQGERDTLMGTSKAAYATRLDAVIDWLRGRNIDAPIYVCGTSLRAGRTGPGIRAAQAAAVDPAAGVFSGPDTDLLGADLRQDGTQLNAAGQDAFAEMLCDTLAAGVADRQGIVAA